MPLVCDYLKTKTLAQLEAEHGVKSRISGHKVSLNYSQLEATDADPVAQECRGLILRRVDMAPIDPALPLGDTVVLARPFDRFFNLGQGAAADVDFEAAGTRFFEKLDGTMCLLYFDDVSQEWHVATRSVPEADLFIDGFESFTFRTLFERAVKDTTGSSFDEFVGRLSHMPKVTFIFELTTPVNRIVVSYENYGITLLGARHRSGDELDPVRLALGLDVPSAQTYSLDCLADMVDFVSGRNPQVHEGIVVCDADYRRVKVKNAGYLALNKVRDSVTKSPRALLELVLLEKLDDVIPLIPEVFIERGREMQSGLRVLFRSYDEFYAECLAEADVHVDRSEERAHRKAFALTVTSRRGWMAPLMDQYIGRSSSLRDWIDRKRQVDGGWSNSFLDAVMRHIHK